MSDPYEILGVSAEVDEGFLRRRYLELVRQYPPEKYPEQFAEIREAYERVRDPVRRLQRQLFETGCEETLDDVISDVRTRLQSARISTKTLLSLGDK